jgi:hypothetical protein
LEVVRTIVKLVRAFPKQTQGFLIPFMEPIWNQLRSFSDKYSPENDADALELDVGVDSDGEIVGYEALLFSMIEYIGLATRKRKLRSLMSKGKGTAGDFIILLVQVLIKYMQITEDMESAWTSDINQFIQDDEEEALNFNVRIAVRELLDVCL